MKPGGFPEVAQRDRVLPEGSTLPRESVMLQNRALHRQKKYVSVSYNGGFNKIANSKSVSGLLHGLGSLLWALPPPKSAARCGIKFGNIW